MSTLSALLEPIAGDNPCGVDLWQDGTLMLLQQMITIDPESQAEPKWSEVRETAQENLTRGKDLRGGVILTLALFREEGPAGLKVGLELLKDLLEKYPQQLHPVPENDEDPIRGSALSNLSAPMGSESPYQFVRWLRDAPLVRSATGTGFSLADLKRADRGTPQEGAEGSPLPSRDQIESAFREAGTEAMLKTYNLFADIQAKTEGIEKLLSGHNGSQSGLDLKAFKETLGEILAELKPSTGQAAEPAATPGSTEGQPSGPAAGVPGAIRSRADADRALKAVCDYFRQQEPSSPIPFFLDRVRRLIGKNFVECVRDLSAESLERFYPLFGINPSNSGEEEKPS